MSATAMNTENNVRKIYQTVIDEVLTNIREAFLDEGYDEQLLQELKHMWENKLNASRAVQENHELSEGAASGEPPGAHSNLRLPVTHSKTSGAAAAHQSSSSSAADAPAKQGMDPATRAALQALPQSIYSSAAAASSGSTQDIKPKKQQQQHMAAQLDGGGIDDISSDDEDEENELGDVGEEEEDEDDFKNNDDQSENEGREDSDPLNSNDDLSEAGSPSSEHDLFDTEHVIVCQYDKITRIKNKWKFHLKDGIMNINGKDYLFSKAIGDAEW